MCSKEQKEPKASMLSLNLLQRLLLLSILRLKSIALSAFMEVP